MSLARLALRLATVDALAPAALLTSNGPWPTLAGKHVYDSRIDPIEDLKPDAPQLAVAVYTEYDKGKGGQARGGPPFLQTVDLTFEISVIVKVASEADPAVFVVGEPETDAELEASIDLLEAQIRFALLYAPAGETWRQITKSRVHDPGSLPHRTSEEGARLAKRTVTWKVEVNDDCYDPAPAVTPAGAARLPFPLQYLATALAATSYGGKIIAGLTGEPTLPVMPNAVPLASVALNVAAYQPGATPPATPNIVGEVDNLDEDDA